MVKSLGDVPAGGRDFIDALDATSSIYLCFVTSIKANAVNFAEVFIVRNYIWDFVILHEFYI